MAGGRKPFVPKGLSAGQSRSARAISGSGGPERCDRGGPAKGSGDEPRAAAFGLTAGVRSLEPVWVGMVWPVGRPRAEEGASPQVWIVEGRLSSGRRAPKRRLCSRLVLRAWRRVQWVEEEGCGRLLIPLARPAWG